MVIKDIIYIMVVALFTVACWLQVESVPRGVKLLPLVYLRRRLMLLVGSRWNMFHVEPDCFMPRNNLAATPQVAVGCRLMAILSEEWRGVINRIYNSKRPLAFAHVILTKALGVHRARDIRQRITMSMCL